MRLVVTLLALGLIGLYGRAGADPVVAEWSASDHCNPDQVCSWTSFDSAVPENPACAGSALRLQTSDAAEFMHYETSASLDVPGTWIIRARLRVLAEAHSAADKRGVQIGFVRSADSGNFLQIGVDELFLWDGFEDPGPVVAVDTDGAFHDYRIEITATEARVYHDDVLKTTMPLINHVALPNSPYLYWGDGTGTASSTSDWESFSHNGSTLPCAKGVPAIGPFPAAVAGLALLIAALLLLRRRGLQAS
jgi:hypothetical protein